MNFRNIGLVIGREYNTRVRKKSFLILTFVVPILFAVLAFLPTIIMMNTKEETREVAVVDKSGIAMPFLTNSEAANYYDFSNSDPDSLKAELENMNKDILVVISPLDSTRSVSVQTFSKKPAGVDFSESLSRRVSNAVEDYRINSYDIQGLDEIMSEVRANIKVQEYTLGDNGKETVSESGIYMIVSMVLGMLIYMFVAMFSGMVMSSVIEEKSSRVVEVLVSSVKSIDLMFGKIIGVALVALTQFALWILLTAVILGVGGAAFGGKILGKMADPAQQEQMMEMATGGIGVHPDLTTVIANMDDSNSAKVILTTLGNIPWGTLLISFLIYFILGYLLYASLFAAVGSAVENEADSTQLQLPVTIPLLIGFFIALMAMRNPYSQVVWWGSMIPFTSPIVMLARIPYGVPTWELIVSIAVLLVTFALCAWASAKIYRAGILIFGKKSSWRDLWKWLKQK
ncbi:MAG: ABC transporter permease [Bacteroidales bacterium]|nr:ABC transporter permease [Bacteroidales bacterium]